MKYNFLSKTVILVFWVIVLVLFLFSSLLKKQRFNNSINVLTWGGMIDVKSVYEFEGKTGIKVNLNYYETNDELVSKIQTSKAKDYDLITITDSAFNYFKENDIVKKIDKSKLDFIHEIDDHLFGHKFDPNYDYSIPFFWDLFGLGINKDFFENRIPKASWALIFDKKNIPGKIAMTDDPINAILIASQYLFGNIKLDKAKLKNIKELLLSQKKIVEVYTDLKSDFLLQMGICPVITTQSAYIYKVIKENSNLNFLIPNEGGFLIINLLVIPKMTNKEEYVYRFINFLFQHKIAKKHFKSLGYLPVQKKLLYSIDLNYLGGINNIFSPEIFSKLSLFEASTNISEINQIWTEVKA